ncbi:hypothetical protein [Halomonas koreensis]|uniref:Uncharacterized protein n=1 Tax=Halomonas koreensis TaxID=245385 RepID=A0ABU1FX72_9GAMM|nr:hypothetical protein [Halomonas koreensis]MDR5865286.1 hypothetical protein [Halomonas koreensis]
MKRSLRMILGHPTIALTMRDATCHRTDASKCAPRVPPKRQA